MDPIERVGPLLGRLLIAALFLLSGMSKVSAFDTTVAFIAGKGLPLAEAGAVCAAIAEIGGGILLLIGFQTRVAALGLLFFTFAATILFHDFWNAADADVRQQVTMFVKNSAIAGGLIYVASFGAGPLSLDERSGQAA